MTTAYKVLGQSNPPIKTSNTLYTVPAGNNTIVSSLSICNIDNIPNSFRVAIRPSGQTLSNTHYISYNTFIPAQDTITLSIGMTLAATDIVTVYSNTANMSFLNLNLLNQLYNLYYALKSNKRQGFSCVFVSC
jgi:hypothetical protein